LLQKLNITFVLQLSLKSEYSHYFDNSYFITEL